jgi:hypothetical protein
VTRVREELAAKKPRLLWLVRMGLAGLISRKRRVNLMQRLTEKTRTAQAFCHYNRYLVLRLDRAQDNLARPG